MTDDPFAQLGLPRRYALDRAALQAAYLKRVSLLHPDRVNDPLGQAEAAQSAARLNDARALLADDEQRANLLLRLLGGPTKERHNALPEGFLVRMMQVREEMEEALAGNDERERGRLQAWAAGKRDEHVGRVSTMFQSAAAADGQAAPELLRDIRTELNAWRYIERMIEQLDPEYHRPL